MKCVDQNGREVDDSLCSDPEGNDAGPKPDISRTCPATCRCDGEACDDGFACTVTTLCYEFLCEVRL